VDACSTAGGQLAEWEAANKALLDGLAERVVLSGTLKCGDKESTIEDCVEEPILGPRRAVGAIGQQ
tara:strand:- start:69 stop:266 length:198 start_codon:yes stop_codon:yes gene_type:complete